MELYYNNEYCVPIRQIDCTIQNIYKLERVPKLTFNSNRHNINACECIIINCYYYFHSLGLTCDVLCFASSNCEIPNLEDCEENKRRVPSNFM